jgi:hypothetical protein
MELSVFGIDRRAGWCQRNTGQGCQPVAPLGRSLHNTARIVPQRFAQLRDALHQAVIGDDHIGPYRLHQLVFGDHPSSASRQAVQHLQRLWTQRDSQTCDVSQFEMLQVEYKIRRRSQRLTIWDVRPSEAGAPVLFDASRPQIKIVPSLCPADESISVPGLVEPR